MKKISIFIVLLASTFFMQAQTVLPSVKWNNPCTLEKALQSRSTTRSFSNKPIDSQTLSNLLWAANGVNREDGRRTAPSARNCQEIDIYLFTPENVQLYVPEDHSLKIVVEGDYRHKAAIQPFAAKAPLLLVYVANYDKMGKMDKESQEFYGATDCGFVSQNVYLFCAAENLNTVVLGMINREAIQELLQINGKAILAQPIGYNK